MLIGTKTYSTMPNTGTLPRAAGRMDPLNLGHKDDKVLNVFMGVSIVLTKTNMAAFVHVQTIENLRKSQRKTLFSRHG